MIAQTLTHFDLSPNSELACSFHCSRSSDIVVQGQASPVSPGADEEEEREKLIRAALLPAASSQRLRRLFKPPSLLPARHLLRRE